MSYPLRVGVSPGTTSLVIDPAGLGQVYLNPGSGPFAACPPDPAVKFAVDPWRPSTGFQPAGLRITMPSPSASTVLPTRTGAPVTVGGKPHLVFENVYGTASSLKGAGPSWKATALILGGAFLGGVGVALAVHFAKRSATPLMLREARLSQDLSGDEEEEAAPVDKTEHPSVIEYAAISLIKGKSPTAAAEYTVKKLAGRTNMFLGPGTVEIDSKRLESLLYDRMAESAIQSMRKWPPKEGKARLVGYLQKYFPDKAGAARAIPQKTYVEVTKRIVSELGTNPFTDDPATLAIFKLKPLSGVNFQGTRPYTKAEWARFERDKSELNAIANDAEEAYGSQADALWKTYLRKWDEFRKRHG